MHEQSENSCFKEQTFPVPGILKRKHVVINYAHAWNEKNRAKKARKFVHHVCIEGHKHVVLYLGRDCPQMILERAKLIKSEQVPKRIVFVMKLDLFLAYDVKQNCDRERNIDAKEAFDRVWDNWQKVLLPGVVWSVQFVVQPIW